MNHTNVSPEILYDLKVIHRKREPVFVVGYARSGTSILIKMLRKYLKVNFGTESQFIIRYFKNLDHYGELNDPYNLSLLITNISRERCFSRWKERFKFELNPEEVKTNVRRAIDGRSLGKDEIYREILSAIFMQFAAYHQMVRWGDKTPQYMSDLPILLHLFPKAQFIHIVRDGRDVALSSFLTHFGPQNAYKAALGWKNSINKMREFRSMLSSDQFIEIRYEDLLTDTVDIFAELIKFLDIDDRHNKLLCFIAENIESDLKKNNFFKWKKLFNRREQVVFDKISGDILTYYQYETLFDRSLPITIWEYIFWELDNVRKKIVKITYWKDNFYKFRLRIKELFLPLRGKIRG